MNLKKFKLVKLLGEGATAKVVLVERLHKSGHDREI